MLDVDLRDDLVDAFGVVLVRIFAQRERAHVAEPVYAQHAVVAGRAARADYVEIRHRLIDGQLLYLIHQRERLNFFHFLLLFVSVFCLIEPSPSET